MGSACGAESYSSALGPDPSAELCNAGIYRHNKTNPNPTLTLTLTLTTEALVGHALARTDEVERQIAAQGALTQQAVSAATAEAKSPPKR